MTRSTRWIIGVAAAAMGAAYVLPLWSIALIAPQYPEGLGMLIRISSIGGFKESDLQSINGLNHYIGMKEIVPESIPELKWMPAILGVLIVSGLVVAWVGRRGPLYAWAATLALVFLAGLGDFWKWGYEYGHDLAPNAIIKVPGMTYQPPIIGSKQLLNFRATSWPASGGWILIAAAAAVAGVLASTLRRRSRHAPARVATAALAVTVAGCAPAGPRAIVLNEDACVQCRMQIADARFGAEGITTTGRTLTFDSVECLIEWARATPSDQVRAVYVIDLQHPGTFVVADSAGFLQGALLGTPMGRNIVSFANATAAEEQRAMLGGTVATWRELLAARVSSSSHPADLVASAQ
jgi:copper chaperone NosL